MDIQSVNKVLVTAIEHFQAAELEGLWEFNVPSPHEMHRKHGMALPADQFTVPTPAQMKARSQKTSKPKKVTPKKKADMEPREVSQAEAKSGAAKTQDQLRKVFDKLKHGQIVWVSFSSVMSMRGQEYFPYRVGRRGHSKKHGVTTITLLQPGQKKPRGRGMQTHLRRDKDGIIGIGLGDMWADLKGIYAP